MTRADRKLDISSFDDPRLRDLTIGVQMVGNDAMNTPPAHALARRGVIANVRGYMLYGDYRSPQPAGGDRRCRGACRYRRRRGLGPARRLFCAKGTGAANRNPGCPAFDGSQFPMTFDIAMGVRKGDTAFRDVINDELDRNRAAIEGLLNAYHTPLLPQ